MENVTNTPQNPQMPQNPPQAPQNPQYAQYPPQGVQYAQNPQAPQYPPQYAQYPTQGPQYAQYPQYGAGGPMPPKKKSVWPTVLMIGCGCLVGIALVLAVFSLLMLRECEQKNKDRTTPMIEELNVTENLVLKNNLDSVQIKELIYIGMPKDSVLITLGKPDDYLDASWGDYVTYQINDST